MYSIQDGGVCHVDLGAILQYGGGELPPARLTRNVLAVCDITVTESRLQSILSYIRDSRELLLPAITVSFKWMEDQELMNKLHHVKNLILGSTLSHKVTVEELSKSNRKYKEKYIELLEDVFADFEVKETYTIEEQ
ncbi:jg4904, partial [Pararge aegeria aegeria]